MSVCVISLVVWLTLVFLSVTEGMERGWLKKLTSVNAPIRLTPTHSYYRSYYHIIDQLSYASGYQVKSLREKWLSDSSDPYDPEVDAELPRFLPEPIRNLDGSVKDVVKETFEAVEECGIDLSAAPFEMTGGLLKLRMIHPEFEMPGEEQQNYLTQVTYIGSFPENNPNLKNLLLNPKASEIDHLFHMAALSSDGILQDEASLAKKSDSNKFYKAIKRLAANLELKEISTATGWEFPSLLLPEETPFQVKMDSYGGRIGTLTFTDHGSYRLERRGKFFYLDGKKIHQKVHLRVDSPLIFSVNKVHTKEASSVSQIRLSVEGKLQGKNLNGEIPYKDIALEKISAKQNFTQAPKHSPPWPYFIAKEGRTYLPKSKRETPIVIAKSYQESGVQVGDLGYISYSAQTTSGVQEQRIPVSVAGFYDPGIMAIGNKCIFTDADLVTAIRNANHSYTLDRSISTGINVWVQDLDSADGVAERIRDKLEAKGLAPFWRVESFRQYDFARDLLQQFESDKYLFTMIGIIILIVACTNIISLLSLLVNDKKEEVAILQAMGATKRNIATIFAGSGVILGLIGSIAGTGLAVLTLHNIDHVTEMLSFLQGREAFNSAFYGASLPNELSRSALIFILISTPIISLVAGLVPALKACRLQPSEVLK